jgi:hypothetical protein
LREYKTHFVNSGPVTPCIRFKQGGVDNFDVVFKVPMEGTMT